ncbi:HAD family hydrolase [Weissella confusa]|uniref:HAD family hydrolase n=1 Tax=Weissella confusa TaxID=1583 RepID=UPI001FB2E1D1|nr:HAD family hydrolase [Weissella confusa]
MKRLTVPWMGIALEKEYRQYLNENYFVLDGAEDLLKNLVNQGYKLIAGTNGEQRTQELRLEHTGFGRYFDDVFISDAIGHAKSSTEFSMRFLVTGKIWTAKSQS